MPSLAIAVHGAAGRMGRRLVALAAEDPAVRLVAALEHADCPELGQDVGTLAGAKPVGVYLASQLEQPVDVVIDFSVPAAAESIAQQCAAKRIPVVVATTGLNAQQQAVLQAVAAQIPLVWAPSMSLAVNLTMKLATLAGKTLADKAGGADVEIIERHHHHKEDAPSGTALRFGQLIAEVMGQTVHRHGRQGFTGKRPANEIGYHAVRVGDNPGEHTIIYGMSGETIELTVRATNRDCYALGALAAAKFVAGRAPGMYTMYDVLEL